MNINPYFFYLQQNIPSMNQNFPPSLNHSNQMPNVAPMGQYHQAMMYSFAQSIPFFPANHKGYKHPLPVIQHKVKYFDPS
jgi:hypothetical protein